MKPPHGGGGLSRRIGPGGPSTNVFGVRELNFGRAPPGRLRQIDRNPATTSPTIVIAAKPSPNAKGSVNAGSECLMRCSPSRQEIMAGLRVGGKTAGTRHGSERRRRVLRESRIS